MPLHFTQVRDSRSSQGWMLSLSMQVQHLVCPFIHWQTRVTSAFGNHRHFHGYELHWYVGSCTRPSFHFYVVHAQCGTAGSYGNSRFSFFVPAVHEACSFSTSLLTLKFWFCLFDNSPPNVYQVTSHCVSGLQFPHHWNVEYIFVWLVAIDLSSLEKYALEFLDHPLIILLLGQKIFIVTRKSWEQNPALPPDMGSISG